MGEYTCIFEKSDYIYGVTPGGFTSITTQTYEDKMHLLFKTVSLSFLLSSFYLATAMERDHEPWLAQTAARQGCSLEDYVAIREALPREDYAVWKEQEMKDKAEHERRQTGQLNQSNRAKEEIPQEDREPWLAQSAAGKGFSREDYVGIREALPREEYAVWKEQEMKDRAEYEKLKNTRLRLAEVVHDQESYRKAFEALHVKDLKYTVVYANEEKSIIRRSWDDYVKMNPFRRVVLFSGHKGHHSAVWGATQGNENYMIDTTEGNEADAMLDVTNAEHIAYIPSNSVDEVVSDWQYFDYCEIYERVLKPGGRLIFPANYFLSDILNTNKGEPCVIFENGRKARLSGEYMRRILQDPAEKKKLEAELMKIAVPFHQNLGFSNVELVEWQGQGYLKPIHLWVLTK